MNLPSFTERKGKIVGLKRRIPLAVSAFVHCLLVFLFLSSTKGKIVTGGQSSGPEGPVFEVVLMPRSRPTSASQVSEQEGGSLRPLFAKFQADPSTPPVDLPSLEKSKVTSLNDRLASKLARPSPSLEARSQRFPQFDQGPLESDSRGEAESTEQQTHKIAGGSVQSEGRPAPTPGAASSGMLWGRIEPCWRALGGQSQAVVVLEVYIDNRGGISVPPRIIRDTHSNISERQLRAEAFALSALATCLPKGDMAFRGQTQRLEFRGR